MEEDEAAVEWISTTESLSKEDESDDKKTQSTNVLWGVESAGGESILGWDDARAVAWGIPREYPWSDSRLTKNEG
jgi:hypothetical protein